MATLKQYEKINQDVLICTAFKKVISLVGRFCCLWYSAVEFMAKLGPVLFCIMAPKYFICTTFSIWSPAQNRWGGQHWFLFFFFLKMNIKVKLNGEVMKLEWGKKSVVSAGSALLWRPKGRASLVKSSAAVQGKNIDQTVIVWIDSVPKWFQILAVTAVTVTAELWG